MIITSNPSAPLSLRYRASYKRYFVAYGKTFSEAINDLLDQMDKKINLPKFDNDQK